MMGKTEADVGEEDDSEDALFYDPEGDTFVCFIGYLSVCFYFLASLSMQPKLI